MHCNLWHNLIYSVYNSPESALYLGPEVWEIMPPEI